MPGIYPYKKDGQLEPFDRVVLLSQSPRRKALLAFLKPETHPVDLDESRVEKASMARYKALPFTERVARTTCEIALAKAGLGDFCDQAIDALPGVLYIAADTMVVLGEKIYHKPRDATEAETFFRSYFGKTHHVITGVCLRTSSTFESFYSVTDVRFTDYDPSLEDAIVRYLASGHPMDKAGAYGIQELDPRFVTSVQGDFQTVVGLPVSEIRRRILPFHRKG